MKKNKSNNILIIVLILAAVGLYFVDGLYLLKPAATYSTIETVNGYEIKSRSSCCTGNKLVTSYYIDPPGFQGCAGKCVFSTSQDAKEYALSLPGTSIGVPVAPVGTSEITATPNEYTINIWADQSATAYVDGSNVGTLTADKWLSVRKPNGAYTIRVSRDGYTTFIREITLNNKDVQITAYLNPTDPSTTSTSTPSTSSSEPEPTHTPFNTPGFESLYAVAGLIATSYLVLRRKP